MKQPFHIDNLPILAEYYGITYFGPHISQDRFNNQYVLSALRKVDLPEREDAYVYIESGFKLTQSILDLDEVSKHTNHLILDNNGRISYSELQDSFLKIHFSDTPSPSLVTGITSDYYWYRQVSNQGWSVVSLIAKSDYNREKNRWMMQMLGLALLFAVVSLTIGWLLWKMVYRPLSRFHKEIKSIAGSNFNAAATESSIRNLRCC